MSGFNEHFLAKYFAYRRPYVDYVARENPRRTRLAVLAELVRLSFVTFGSVLCGLVFWLLVVAAFGRGGPALFAAVTFVVLAVLSTWFAALAIRGLASAWHDPRRLTDTAKAAR